MHCNVLSEIGSSKLFRSFKEVSLIDDKCLQAFYGFQFEVMVSRWLKKIQKSDPLGWELQMLLFVGVKDKEFTRIPLIIYVF